MTQQPTPATKPVVSLTLDDVTIPGVMVEVDPETAEAMGAFEETAISDADAFDASFDMGDDEELTDGRL